MHESTILSFLPPTCIAHPGAALLHDSWTENDAPSELSFVGYAPYNTGNNNTVLRPWVNGRRRDSSLHVEYAGGGGGGKMRCSIHI